MKRTLAALTVLILGVTTLSYGVASWCVHRSMKGVVVDLNDTAWLKRELQLTDAQDGEIEKLNEEFYAKLQHCCDAHCAARFTLSEELAKSTVDLSKANTCIDRMAAAQADSERATLDHILRVRAVLTSDQRQHYAALVSKQVCTMGPLGLRHSGP
jgi:Spy/CpxP family protein refolding chaperone